MIRAVILCAETSPVRVFWLLKPPNRADLPAEIAVSMLRPASLPHHIGHN